MAKYKNCTDYWLDCETVTFRGDFEAMYQDVEDPWGCEAGKDSLNNQIFVSIIFDGNKRFDRILDIGCGQGGLLNAIKTRNGGGYVLGLDVSQTAIQKARRRYPALNLICMNILEDELQEGDFDLVVLSEILWYVLDDLSLLFAKVSNMMRAGGTLAIHQYFPTDQRFGKERIDGLSGFLNFIEDRAKFSRQHMFTNHHHDGLVLLSKFRKSQ